MTMLGRSLKVWVAAFGVAVFAGPASADAIDGHWCHNDGRRFSIRGPEIVTPGGKVMEGNYSRHWFSYVVPAPESGAGETIFMTLLNENTVQTKRGEAASAGETWLRCSPSISAIRGLPVS
ncbi:MAG TPA: hypothetical protein VIV34_05200 [Pseudolabrys sp.]